MKRIMLFVAVVAASVWSAKLFGQNSDYIQAMKETLALVDSAKTDDEVKDCIARFERIGVSESNRWEPQYYQAFLWIHLAYRSKDGDQIDKLLDKAQICIDKAKELNPDKSELYALQGWLYQARITVNPMRGMTYSGKAAEVLQKSLELNPSNPRAHFLMGMNFYYTPKMFGGGTKKALPYFERADKLFKASATEDLKPKWGMATNSRMIKVCKKSS
ncbi:MAG: hypothetical protein PWR03_1583 [Tenuifilum sp.]|uniref:tetratricopeptide repeat protein n=1 Tax=Tenuifilum sp. TaxID=2760880 RepID=UPI0024AA31B7|nr:hypothetical protein [Tenuifilum sp.]MDI3527400.1 hypothetical protein [Tenuifilum sp.]